MGSLGTHEVLVLLGDHDRVLDAMLLAKLADAHHLVEVQKEGQGGNDDHITEFGGDVNGRHDPEVDVFEMFTGVTSNVN